MRMESLIFIERSLLDELTRLCVDEIPRQAYGLIGWLRSLPSNDPQSVPYESQGDSRMERFV